MSSHDVQADLVDSAPSIQAGSPNPRGFHWVIPDLLGGMPRPGLGGNERVELSRLAALNVHFLVSLTEERFDPTHLAEFGITGLHFPIKDMGVPSIDNTIRLCRRVCRWLAAGEPTVLHCEAGLGRTGTMLACILIARGLPPVRALHDVRLVNQEYVESRKQVDFVERFGRFYRPSL